MLQPVFFIMPKRNATSSRRQMAQSNTYRFFVEPEAVQGEAVRINDAEFVHQISHVLRLSVGDQILLLDNNGWEYIVDLTEVGRNHVAGAVERRQQARGEPRTNLTLYLPLIRPEKFEWALQKGTELGASGFVPVISQRSVLASASELGERKFERWNKIIREAAEQSRRGKMPLLASACSFADACSHATQQGQSFLLWEGSGAPSLRAALAEARAAVHTEAGFVPVSVLSGPEGGFTEEEVEFAKSCGIIAVTLGPRTLRAETAPLAAAAAILYDLGDMD